MLLDDHTTAYLHNNYCRRGNERRLHMQRRTMGAVTPDLSPPCPNHKSIGAEAVPGPHRWAHSQGTVTLQVACVRA